jgi:prepilin-type N-terminal cleavage/methylation domain-containing protein/prepilin-type processing-associated H-X9-DG protein
MSHLRTRNVSRGSPRAFTLTELLVVIAIIGILSGLLLPAVQMAREAARRIQCANHLKQLALAMHSYHDIHRVLPPALIGDEERADGWSWAAMLLPQIEQQPLHSQIDFSRWPTDEANASLIATPLSVFRCPSEVARRTATYIELDTFQQVTVPLDNYGLSGTWGVIYGDVERVSFSDVRDGLTNTILLAESTFSSLELEEESMFGELLTGGITWSTSLFAGGEPTEVVILLPGVICTHGIREPGESHLAQPSSYHPGGAQFALFDGSVRFISAATDAEIFTALSTRDGGETIGEY